MNSSHCLINFQISELVIWNSEYNHWENYTGETVKFDYATEQLLVNTTNTTYLEIFLVLRTNKSAPLYFPITVNINQFPTEQFNKKPEFRDPSDYTVDFIMNYFTYTYEIPINVTE